MDRKVIDLLANAGIPEDQSILISILRTQLTHSYDANAKLAAEREKWRRQIAELEQQLSKSNKIGK